MNRIFSIFLGTTTILAGITLSVALLSVVIPSLETPAKAMLGILICDVIILFTLFAIGAGIQILKDE